MVICLLYTYIYGLFSDYQVDYVACIACFNDRIQYSICVFIYIYIAYSYLNRHGNGKFPIQSPDFPI